MLGLYTNQSIQLDFNPVVDGQNQTSYLTFNGVNTTNIKYGKDGIVYLKNLN